MKNLKPSLLPAGTVIGRKAWGKYNELYLKHEHVDGAYWEDLFSGCGCCMDHVKVADNGVDNGGSDQADDEDDEDEYEHYWRDPRGLTTSDKSDDYFVDYKVVAADPSFNFGLVELHGPWVDEYGTYADGTAIHTCPGYNCEA